MIKRLLVAPAVVAALVLLSACDPTPGPAGPSPSSSPTPEASPSVEAPVQPTVAELILSPEGLGPLVIGAAPPVTDPALDIAILDPDYCSAYAADFGVPAGKWIPNYEPALSTEDGGDPFALYVPDGTLAGLDIRSPLIHTATGIHIGSTLAELNAAYPGGFAEVYDHVGISDVYVLDGTHGRLFFELPKDDEPGYWTAAELDKVLFIHVVRPSDDTFGVSATDAGYGGCVSA